MSADLSEKGLETVIVNYMTSSDGGWLSGNPKNYEREYAVDLMHLTTFLHVTQPDTTDALDLDHDSPIRRKFLARLQGEIAKRGVVDVLRNGIKHGPYNLDLFYGTPSPGNDDAQRLYALNRFSVTRQLRYSRDETQLALDLGLFVNGLPISTFELKNNLTKQTAEDAVDQYKRDRDPRELLFQLGRCMAHFAVDDQVVRFCTHLRGKASWFLPFDQGYNEGAGNPPNPHGLKTDYLWKRILSPSSLTNILENYAQIVSEKDSRTGQKKVIQIFPRYHQLDVVRKLLADGAARGTGRRYLIEHSAGSGKSNSIAWLAHQLIGLEYDNRRVFDSIIVVTDRVILDKQIRDTIKQFSQVGSTVVHADSAGDLRTAIEAGKKIIITTIQKFPFIYREIGDSHRGNTFAIVIDEAHSSQSGQTTSRMSEALSAAGAKEDDETLEDAINRVMASRKMLTNASYYAFTATPKNKTLETFGEPYEADGKTKHRPFHTYTMKQAIQEGFILDVLANYTPINSYYRLVKTVEADPEFDAHKANKKLRRYVEGHDHAIRLKAEIIVDHFHDQVLAMNKIGGKARAMVVTSTIERAIRYHFAIQAYLKERKSPYLDIVAFSGEPEYHGQQVSEGKLNNFPSRAIADRIKEDPYRFLVCADKFQTGYDEPLLHTMYVDKPLSGIKAVQTLSRLNRAHPQKHDVMVLDFANDADTIRKAFQDYYRTTILSEETDPNKLHDLKADLDGYQVYEQRQVDDFVALYLGDGSREQLDPILDACVATYSEQLDEDGQVDFKGKAKAFVRTYSFLAALLPYTNAEWEKLSIFLNFLILKLPAPKEEDLSRGILETIDMDSYRVEKQATVAVALADENAEIAPVPAAGGGHMPEPELDLLSNIIKTFNDQWGNIPWADTDRIHRLIAEDIPNGVAADGAYQNAMRNNDRQNARIEHDKALVRVMTGVLKADTQLFKQFSDNEFFKKWLSDSVFAVTYDERKDERRQISSGDYGRSSEQHQPAGFNEDPRVAQDVTGPERGSARDAFDQAGAVPTRYLAADFPERAPSGVRVSLLVRIMLAPTGAPSAPLKPFPVPSRGATVTISVTAPDLIATGDLEQELLIPANTDSEPVRFGFSTGPMGLHMVTVRAFAGGTFLGELKVQISVESGASLEEGRTQKADLASPIAEPGEVTLQVDRSGDRYSFQLVSEAWQKFQLSERLAGDPTKAVEALVAELRVLASGRSPYRSPKQAQARLRNLGAQLWADAVPETVRRQFWEQADHITTFTVLSDLDNVPWELLYPVDGPNELGFLCERYPVVRRVYGQGRTRSLALSSAAYVVPQGSPANAMDEVTRVRARLGRDIADEGVLGSLEDLTEMLDRGQISVVHFACHNRFSNDEGSMVAMVDGPFRPSDLSLAVQRKALAGAGSLIFFNACRSAGETLGLTRTMGWAKQFMGAGAGAFIGSLWPVRSSSAGDFADAFYAEFVAEQQPLGRASWRARKAIADELGDPTWLAYTVYGNPEAKATSQLM